MSFRTSGGQLNASGGQWKANGGIWKANGRPMDGEWEASRIRDFCIATRRMKSARRRRVAHKPWPIARVRTCASMTFGIAKVSLNKEGKRNITSNVRERYRPRCPNYQASKRQVIRGVAAARKTAKRRTTWHYGLVVGHAALFSMHINLIYLQSKPKACPTSP